MSFPHFVVNTKNEEKIYIQRDFAVSRCIVAALTVLETVSQDTTIRVISGQWWERKRFKLCSTREIGVIQKDITSPVPFYTFTSRLCKKRRKKYSVYLTRMVCPHQLQNYKARLQNEICR